MSHLFAGRMVSPTLKYGCFIRQVTRWVGSPVQKSDAGRDTTFHAKVRNFSLMKL